MKKKNHIQLPPEGTRVLLHACCAPCSGAIVEYLVQHGIKPALFYSNSNIAPVEEYVKRREECRRYASKWGIEFIEDIYDHKAWLAAVRGLEREPEKGRRCSECFRFRLSSAARYASENGYTLLTTTLASSRWKDLSQVNGCGEQVCRDIPELEFWSENWRRDGLQDRRNQIIKEENFYNQLWCGCEFSHHDMEKIIIKSGTSFSPLASLVSGEDSVYLVYDSNIETYAKEVEAVLPSLKGSFAITADEAHKTMDTVMEICRFLSDANVDRGALLLTMGGGVTSDMAGFAACIYKRGIRYANIPTTLLAQVDAGIGGKTGVNLDGYKNLLGVICQPQWVYINSTVLQTLSRKQILSGAAELLKTMLLSPEGRYVDALDAVAALAADANPQNFARLTEYASLAASIKAEVVRQDPYEKGLRRILNLGHSFAHAIEWAQKEMKTVGVAQEEMSPGEAVAAGIVNPAQEAMSHGEAVAAGMVIAAQISELAGVCREGFAARLASDLRRCGLPDSSPVPLPNLREALKKDKKADGGEIWMVLPCEVGKVETRKMKVEEIYDLLGYSE